MNADAQLKGRGCKSVPIAVLLITLNEAHNLPALLDNIAGWAQEIFIVDSYSTDRTVDIALESRVHVVQRRFRGFGDQWNFALNALPITAPWTMKLDPDERLTPELKSNIRMAVQEGNSDALRLQRRLWFMGRSLLVRQKVLRVWRTGSCRFSDVLVNEHPIVDGRVRDVEGELEHRDSPHLHHWWDKQNRYSTAEAISTFRGSRLAAEPKLFGTSLQRRMWLKAHYRRVPFRYTALFVYNLVRYGAWRAGPVGIAWARLRAEVYRMRDLKLLELRILGHEYEIGGGGSGAPDPRIPQY